MTVKNSINTKSVVAKLLSALPDRNRDIVSRRFGLADGQKETLESIGKSYGITRERVRQIEEASLTQLRKVVGDYSQIKPHLELAQSILEEHGGIMKEEDLFEQFSGVRKNNSTNAALVIAMTLDNQFSNSGDTDSMHSFWALSGRHIQEAGKSLISLARALEKTKEPVMEADLHQFYQKKTNQTIHPKALLAYASLSKSIDKNIFGEMGLSHWPEINPRGVRDKAYLVLKRANKPLHFREITEGINTAGFNNRKANVQTVHNELIKDKRFVLVGRGIYALSQWGYKSGTVKDVLAQILTETKKPMTRDELIQKVLATRFVKENTILLNLQDSKFKKLSDGRYIINTA